MLLLSVYNFGMDAIRYYDHSPYNKVGTPQGFTTCARACNSCLLPDLKTLYFPEVSNLTINFNQTSFPTWTHSPYRYVILIHVNQSPIYLSKFLEGMPLEEIFYVEATRESSVRVNCRHSVQSNAMIRPVSTFCYMESAMATSQLLI